MFQNLFEFCLCCNNPIFFILKRLFSLILGNLCRKFYFKVITEMANILTISDLLLVGD